MPVIQLFLSATSFSRKRVRLTRVALANNAYRAGVGLDAWACLFRVPYFRISDNQLAQPLRRGIAKTCVRRNEKIKRQRKMLTSQCG